MDLGYETAKEVLRKVLPGIYKQIRPLSSGAWHPYWPSPPDSAYLRFRLGDIRPTEFRADEDIAYQIEWDTPRKFYAVSSFLAVRKFTSFKALFAFMTNANQVTRFIKAGLKTVDPADALFFTSNVSPGVFDALVRKVVSVDHEFVTVDEWHDTRIEVELLLRTDKPVPDKLIREWIETHWKEVQDAAGVVRTPDPAPGYHVYKRGPLPGDPDYDAEWHLDKPRPGLGWYTINTIKPRDFQWDGVYSKGPKRIVAQFSIGLRARGHATPW